MRSNRRLKAERLIAHRELQLLRAANVKPKWDRIRYTAHRQHKLEQAHHELARAIREEKANAKSS
jgi:hypothetical protein